MSVETPPAPTARPGVSSSARRQSKCKKKSATHTTDGVLLTESHTTNGAGGPLCWVSVCCWFVYAPTARVFELQGWDS